MTLTLNDLLIVADPIGKCRLTRMRGGAALRSREVEGDSLNYPEIGKPFFLRGQTLDTKVAEDGTTLGLPTARIINTSPLVEILLLADNQGMLLTTASGSQYLLEAC